MVRILSCSGIVCSAGAVSPDVRRPDAAECRAAVSTGDRYVRVSCNVEYRGMAASTGSQSNVSAAPAASDDGRLSHFTGDSCAGVYWLSCRLAISHQCRCGVRDAGFYSSSQYIYPVER